MLGLVPGLVPSICNRCSRSSTQAEDSIESGAAALLLSGWKAADAAPIMSSPDQRITTSATQVLDISRQRQRHLSQRQLEAPFQRFHRHIGLDVEDARNARQVVGLKTPVAVQIGSDDPKHGIALPRRKVAFHHLRKPPHGFGKPQRDLGILGLEPHTGKNRQPRPDLCRIQHSDVAIDDPCLFQQPNTAQAGRGRKPHLPCQLDIRNAPVALKDTENMAVDRVSSATLSPMLRANTLYEGQYLLGSSVARPLIAKHLVAIAKEIGADAVAHGATGKGNDQVRFELAVNALDPSIKIITPWRQWNIRSRTQLLEYAEKHRIPVPSDKRGEAPFSIDANLLHTSTEGKILENPAEVAPDHINRRTIDPVDAPDAPEIVTVGFESGDPVAVNGKAMTPAALLTELNELGGRHGIGRLDLVENRFIGMKSRGVYETPGGAILLARIAELNRSRSIAPPRT